MALNDLLHHHQVALMRAAVTSGVDRFDHRQSAFGFARRIEAATRANRADAAPLVPLA